MKGVQICRFDVTGDLAPKDRKDYARVLAYVLLVGRFSSFEASDTATSARIFTRLCAEPDLETFDLGFPWTGVAPATDAPKVVQNKNLREYWRRRAVYHADAALTAIASGHVDEAGEHASWALKACRRYFDHRT